MGQFGNQWLVQHLPLGGKENYRDSRPLFRGIGGQSLGGGGKNRLRFHYHSGAAAELIIVGGAMGIAGVGADVRNDYGHQAAADSPTHQAVMGRAGKGFRKQG